MNQDLKQYAQLHDENIELKKEIEESYINGVLTGLKICKEMWAQGTISHENIYENEVYYKEQLKELNTSVKRLKGEREWISINKFPKDRILPVLLFNGNAPKYNRHVFNGTWFSETQKFIPDNKNHYFLGSITHWMPLPDKPKQ